MKKFFLTMFFSSILFVPTFWAQSTETFETETNGSTSFSDNGQVFNITSQAQGPFDIQGAYPGTGWNGTSADNKYIDNDGFAVANMPVGFTISSSGAVPFRLNSMYLFLANHNGSVSISGSLTIVGKLGGVTKFTATASSGFNTNISLNKGFSFINMTTFGGSDNTATNIDQIVITTTNFFEYVALDAFTWTIAPSAPSITTHPASSTLCAAGNTTFSIVASNATSYQWEVNTGSGYSSVPASAPYSGTTTNTLTITSATSGMNGYLYHCIATGATSPAATSNAATLTVNTAPSVNTQPTNQTACAGTAATFSITTSGSGLTYQWRRNSTTLTNTGVYTGATTSVLSISDITGLGGSTFDCVVTGICSPAVTSNTATLTVNTAPSVNTQPANQTLCAGTAATFSITASGSGLTYQWRKSSATLTNTGVYSGATTAVLSISDVTGLGGSTFDCVVTGICSPAVTSNTATLTVNTAPSVNTQPTNQTACAGTAATFSITASGSGLTYQWRKNSTTLTNTGVYSGATTSVLSISDITGLGGSTFDCVVTGICSPAVTSNTATLTVNTAPSVNTQPANQTLCAGTAATFSITASGSGLTYQWRKNSTTLTNTGVYSGATTSVLSISDVTGLGGSTFDCVVTGACSPTATSSTATLTVNAAPSVNTQPANQTFCAGVAATFSITASGNGLTYQWRKNSTTLTNTGVYSGATTSVLSISDVTGLGGSTFDCVVTGACSPTATSSTATLTVNAAPSVNTQPANQTFCAGVAATFSITASGSGLTYQWRKNSTTLTNTGVYSGATTSVLSISDVTGLGGSTFDCVVTGACSPTATSNAATLTENAIPVVLSVTPGSRCGVGTLMLGATASAGTLDWYSANMNGSSLGTGMSFTTPSLSVTTTYYAEASANGCTSGRTAVQATVNDLPVVVANASSATLCAGAMVTLTGGGAATYVWTGGVSNGIGFIPSATATYTVTGTDANTCTNTATLTVDVNPVITNVLTVTSPICGNMNGSVSAATAGGAPPYGYLWNNTQTAATVTGLSGLPTQTLIVTITDSKGCLHKDTAFVNCVVAIEENAMEIDLHIFPNPANGKFTLELNSTQPAAGHVYSLEIYNSFGEKVYENRNNYFSLNAPQGIPGTNFQIDLSSQPGGVYFLKVQSDKKTYMEKIMITK